MTPRQPIDHALAVIPPHWRVARVTNVAQVNPESLPETTPPDYLFHYIDISSVAAGGKIVDTEPIRFAEAPSRARRIVRRGDVLVSTVRTYLRAIARVDEADNRVASTGFAVVRAREGFSGEYLYWWLRSDPFVDQVVAQSVGVSYPAINARPLSHIAIACPPRGEQERIAGALERECGLLDAMIAEQQQLIDHLAERRLALISRAVTGRLGSPDIDTGTTDTDDGADEWFGALPAGWQPYRLKHLGRALIGLTYGPADVCDDGQGTLVLRAGNIQHDTIDLTTGQVWVDTPIDPRLRLQTGDILICARNGSARLIGKSAVIPDSLAGQTWGAFMLVFRSNINPFLSWVLRSTLFTQQAGLFATSTINQLTVSTINNMRVPIPPSDEQARICDFLEGETAQMDLMAAEAQRLVRLYRERRQGLITAAVTGQWTVA